MILGDNSKFPHLFGINPAEPENPFFHVFLTFRDHRTSKWPNILRGPIFGNKKTYEPRIREKGSLSKKIDGPTRPDSLAVWDHLFYSSWLRCRPFSSPWLRLDLKTSIKIVPREVSRGGGGETQNHETGDRRLPPEKIGGGKRHRNHLRKAPPSPLRKSPSSPSWRPAPSPSPSS